MKKCDTLDICKNISCENCKAFQRIEALEEEIEELEIKNEYHQKGLKFIKSTIKEKNSIPDMVLSPSGWEGLIQLDVWKFYPSNPDEPFKTGRAKLLIDADNINQEHLNAYNYMIENSEKIQKNMLEILYIRYNELSERYLDMPVVNEISQLKKYIDLKNVYIHNTFKDKISYIGYEFECEWELEHGLGFITLKDKIIKSGHADLAFLSELAEQDLEENI